MFVLGSRVIYSRIFAGETACVQVVFISQIPKMDLLDKEFSAISRNLLSTSNTLFKQDANLALAIDKLKPGFGSLGNEDGLSLSLPERKLQFEEVRRFLSQSSQDPNKAGDFI